MRCHGAGGDMQDRRGQLSGDLEHIGNHQKQALRGRKGDAQRPGLQCAVQGAGRATFALHLNHMRDRTPNVGFDFR